MVLRVLTAIIILTTLIGCSKSESTNVPPTSAAPAVPLKGEPELQGVWRSSCHPGKLEGLVATLNLGITQVTELSVKEDQVTEKTLITSGACDGSDIEVMSFGTYAIAPTKRNGVKAIDLRLGQYRVRPLSEFGVRVLNLAQFCGINDWRVAMVRTIQVDDPVQGCLPKPTVRTVYAIEDQRLYFGFDREVSPGEERGVDLRRDWYFKR